MPEDYPNLLNNLLKSHPSGNLTSYFKYVMTSEGPENDVTHFATAEFRGVSLGVGRGKKKGAAKAAIAEVVYKDFRDNGVPGT